MRVIIVVCGPKKKPVHFFYERTDLLAWDPGRFEWHGGTNITPFMNFSSQLGREILKRKKVIPNPVVRK